MKTPTNNYDGSFRKPLVIAVSESRNNRQATFNEIEIEDIGKEAGLGLRDTKRFLMRLLSPTGPIVGGSYDSEERGMIAMWVEDI